MSDDSNLEKLQARLDAKRDEIREVHEQAKSVDDDGKATYTFANVEADWLGEETLKLKGADRAIRISEQVGERRKEIDDLSEKVEKLRAGEEALKEFERRESTIKSRRLPDGPESKDGRKAMSIKQVVKHFTGHERFKTWSTGGWGQGAKIFIDQYWSEAKALMSTGAGFAPESTRTGLNVDIPLRPLQIIDIMPMGRTSQHEVVWMQQTVRTQAAAETEEGAAKPEAAFEWAQTSTPVQEIAVFLPVTEIQLEDVPMVESLVETQLGEDMMERLDSQIVVGDGVAPNLLGILNTPNVQDHDGATDPVPDAILKAGTLVRTGAQRAIPTHVLLTPSDWQGIRLLKTTEGVYIFGSPSEAGVPRIWGWPVVEDEELAAGQGLIGGFSARNIMLVERRGITIEQGWVNDQFRNNQRSIRASMRAAIQMRRPAAFSTISNLTFS